MTVMTCMRAQDAHRIHEAAAKDGARELTDPVADGAQRCDLLGDEEGKRHSWVQMATCMSPSISVCQTAGCIKGVEVGFKVESRRQESSTAGFRCPPIRETFVICLAAGWIKSKGLGFKELKTGGVTAGFGWSPACQTKF